MENNVESRGFRREGMRGTGNKKTIDVGRALARQGYATRTRECKLMRPQRGKEKITVTLTMADAANERDTWIDV